MLSIANFHIINMLEITLAIHTSAELPLVAEYQPVEFVCATAIGARLELRVDGHMLEPFLRPGEASWRWNWNPGAAVGLHRAVLTSVGSDGIGEQRSWSVRVATRKIDQERYAALLDDLERAAYGLAATLSGAGAEGAAPERNAPWRASPAEYYFTLFEERFEAFERAVRRIAARPREHLRGTRETESLSRAANVGPDAIADLARGPFDEAPADVAAELQAALRPGGGFLPRVVPTANARPSTDIYEHRLLKHTLILLAQRARAVSALARREAERLAASEVYSGTTSTRRRRAEQIADGATGAERTLRELRALPFLGDVGDLPAFRGATPLLLRDPAYRQVYQMWQALRQNPLLAIDSPLMALPIAELPRLYEGWCAVQVAQALLALDGEVREQRLVARRESADELEWSVTLVENAPLLVIERDDTTLTLRYQPRYRPARLGARGLRLEEGDTIPAASRQPPASRLHSLDRHTRVPDLAIEVRRANTPPRTLLLDAKYRLDAEGRGVPEDALADAYTYRGAIGYDGHAATLGAFLLYPGTGEAEFYPSGVGAIPLLPGHTKSFTPLLKNTLDLAF